jgi:hypothetical protein
MSVRVWSTRIGSPVRAIEVVDKAQEGDLDGVVGRVAAAGKFSDGRIDEIEREVIGNSARSHPMARRTMPGTSAVASG